MKKKIIISSIIIIILLISATLTSVVGYKSDETNKIESPLFNIRIKNVIQKDNENYKYNYIGKNKDLPIFFPIKDRTINAFQKAVDSISKLNEQTFTRFVKKACNKLHDSNVVADEDLPKIKDLFNFIRNNPVDAKKYPFDMKKHSYTIGCPPPTLYGTPETCFPLFVLLGLLLITLPIWLPILILIIIIDILI
jgi:hypothetical protein